MSEQKDTVALDFNDLVYYDKKIKSYIDEKAELVASKTYSKDEIDAKLDSIAINSEIVQELIADVAVLKDDRDEAEDAIKRIDATLSEITDLVGNNSTHIDGLKEDINELESSNIIITQKIADIQSSIPSLYVTKEEFQRVSDQSASNNVLIRNIESELVRIDETLETIPTKTSQLDNDAGFISSIPSEYITESELESKGYITEHQSLENYATKEFVEESIDNIDIPKVDLSNYYTKEETEALIPTNYATKDDLQNLVTVEYVTENYVTTEQVGETVAQQVSENIEVQQSIAQEVAKQIETINYGTFGGEI